MKKLTLAFDIEGTLLDKEGNLFPEVYSIFTKADLEKTNFIFLTGGSYKIAQNTVQQINEILPKGQEIKPWICADCGSLIFDKQGHLVVNNSLPLSHIEKIVSIAQDIDPKAIFMYATKDNNFVERQIDASIETKKSSVGKKMVAIKNKLFVNNIALNLFKNHDAKKGACAMDLQDVEGTITGRNLMDVLNEIGDVNQMYVVSLSKNKQAEIQSQIEEEIGDRFEVYNDKYISVPAVSKQQALLSIMLRDSEMPKDASDIVYFGDGANDVFCLENCNISVARGEKAVPEAQKAAKFRLTELDNFADSLYNGEYDCMFSFNNPEFNR